jgi:dienelactone hydrolase
MMRMNPRPLVCCCALVAALSSFAAERLPRTNLLVFHQRDGAVRPVTSKAEWNERRAEILRGFANVAGELPGAEKRCALGVRIEESKDLGGYERRLISYQSEPGSRVPAYLCVPKVAPGGKSRFPAVLCLHPTDTEFGHRVTVETLRDHYRAHAHDLATRGFVVLAPAYPLMANHQPDLKALGWKSGTLKAVWDNCRGLDVLEELPFTRRGKFGVIGHSLGGHNAIFTALLDERITVVVSSCGFDSFPDYYGGNPANWQPERGWCQTRYMPALAAYRGRLAEIPFDFHELLGALAPRAVFVSAPVEDSNFRASSVDAVVNAAAAVYRLHGAEKEMRVVHPPGGHDFPAAAREEAYRWLEEKLGGRGGP